MSGIATAVVTGAFVVAAALGTTLLGQRAARQQRSHDAAEREKDREHITRGEERAARQAAFARYLTVSEVFYSAIMTAYETPRQTPAPSPEHLQQLLAGLQRGGPIAANAEVIAATRLNEFSVDLSQALSNVLLVCSTEAEPVIGAHRVLMHNLGEAALARDPSVPEIQVEVGNAYTVAVAAMRKDLGRADQVRTKDKIE
jgi:hypothetical protein